MGTFDFMKKEHYYRRFCRNFQKLSEAAFKNAHEGLLLRGTLTKDSSYRKK